MHGGAYYERLNRRRAMDLAAAEKQPYVLFTPVEPWSWTAEDVRALPEIAVRPGEYTIEVGRLDVDEERQNIGLIRASIRDHLFNFEKLVTGFSKEVMEDGTIRVRVHHQIDCNNRPS